VTLDAHGPVVRLATPADAPAIAETHVRAWQTAYRGLVPDAILDGLSIAQRTERWHDHLVATDPDARSQRTWVVLDPDAVVVGFAHAGPGNDEAAPPPQGAGEVFSIYLAPEVRGQGYGRAVFARATRDLLDRGFDPIVVWVFEDNDGARRFYEAAGCRLEGTRHDVDFDSVLVPEIRYLLERRPG
jgi:ribosomal protein S18 acetylase RimI-like enzyme